jgi:hypothetical protein
MSLIDFREATIASQLNLGLSLVVLCFVWHVKGTSRFPRKNGQVNLKKNLSFPRKFHRILN